MALARWAIATLIRRATGSVAGGAVAAALLCCNPDVLYLQSTPMTEPLLFGTTFLAVALTAAWSTRSATLAGQPGAALAGGADPLRGVAHHRVGDRARLAVVCAAARRAGGARALRGLAAWPLRPSAFLVNSKVRVGSWFVSGFFVAENPALGHPWLAWTQIWEGLAPSSAPLLPAPRGPRSYLASCGPDRAAPYRLSSLWPARGVPCYAYVKGHPVRIRYDVPLVAAPRQSPARVRSPAAAASPRRRAPPCPGASLRTNGAGRRRIPARGAEPGGPPRRHRLPRTHWDGQPILMSMGSLGHYMHDLSAAGFGIKDFLHEGNGEIWHAARAPPLVEWIAIEERAEGGDALFVQARRHPRFLDGFERVAAGGGAALYRAR